MELGRCVRVGVVAALVLGAITGCTNPGEEQLADLVGDPDATLAFFYPDGVVEPGTSPVAIDYIRDRNWSGDGFGTLARVLDEAATAHRSPDDPRAELSALAATDTINLLGQRDDQINITAYDSLSHLLANYIVDIDIRVQPMQSSLDEPEVALKGLPPGAHFDRTSLDTVTGQVLQSTDAISELTNAALQLNTYRIAAAIEHADPTELKWAVAESRDLVQFVAVTAGFVDLPKPNERTDAMYDQLLRSVYFQPAAGTQFAGFLVGDVLVSSDVAYSHDNFDRYSRVDDDLVRTIWFVTRFNAAAQLGTAGVIRTDGDSITDGWFVDGEFNRSLAVENAWPFLGWMELQDGWSSSFDEFGRRGRLDADA